MKLKWQDHDITSYIEKAVWSGSAKQAARTLSFSLAYNHLDSRFQVVDVKNGDKIKFYDDSGKMLFVGTVSRRGRKSGSGSIEITAHDYMWHLIRSKGTYKFKNKTPETITKAVCSDLKIATGSVSKTKIRIPKFYVAEKEYYNIILAAYTKANSRNKKQYIPRMNGTKLEVIEKGTLISGFSLSHDSNIRESSYEDTTEEMVNQVAVYRKNKKIGIVSNKTQIKKYGIYQEALTVEKGNGRTEAKAMLTGTQKSASLSCVGDSRCTAGRGIKITDKGSGLSGKFWIENDSHTWENGTYTMELELAFQNLMEKESADTESSSKTGSGKIKMSGHGTSSKAVGGKAEKVIAKAKSYIGKVRYVFGAASPDSGRSDCSGFTGHVFRKSVGKELGRTTGQQVTKGSKVSRAGLQPGDLVFFKGTYNSKHIYGVSHVGIYIGSGKFIDCGSSGVRVSDLNNTYWRAHWLMGRRVL